MKSPMLRFSQRSGNPEAGQSTTIIALVMGLFLLGLAGVAVDVSNWWFHRQAAQDAADAACVAGVMDMLANASGVSAGNFPAGSPPAAFSCSGKTGTTPNSGTAACKYAALNGYGAPGLTANQGSNDVFISFPGAVPGLNTCSPTNPPPCVPAAGTVASPFISVNAIDRVPTTFTGLLSGKRTTDVAASAVCGLITATAPVPIIVLNPSCQHAFQLSGSTDVQIVGGPTRSVQVNSSNSTCAAATNNSAQQCTGNPTIDLSEGGPNFTGSEFAVVGSPSTPPSGFNPGTSGDWTNGGPISDPYALVSAPTIPAKSPTDGNPKPVLHNIDGCPDTGGCDEYQPGLYTNPIWVKNRTAIFVPGVYYIQGTKPANSGSPGSGCLAGKVTGQTRYGLLLDTGSMVRPASNTAPNSDGSNGVMFYLSGSSGAGSYGSVYVDSNSGSKTLDPFVTSNATCPGGTAPPSKLNLPTSFQGNVLLGQCTSKGSYIGSGSTDTSGVIRGLIFFQDRANADLNGQGSMQGGGGMILSGNMYFHNCNSSGTGTNCSLPNTGYQAFFQMQGSPGSTSYVLGNITADELVMGGGGTIAMSLNPNAVYNILKATLLQ